MSSIYVGLGDADPETLASCGNCGAETPVGELDMVSDIQERVMAGEVMPAGQCPKCGALAHLPTQPVRVIVEITNGIVECIGASETCEVLVVDSDDNYDGTENHYEIGNLSGTFITGPDEYDYESVHAVFVEYHEKWQARHQKATAE